MLLAVFNDGAMIALSKDKVTPSPVPNRWNLYSIFVQGGRAGGRAGKRLAGWRQSCGAAGRVDGSAAYQQPCVTAGRLGGFRVHGGSPARSA